MSLIILDILQMIFLMSSLMLLLVWLLFFMVFIFVFFFQAEDGIRDWSVTGVQTCALPIFGVAVVAGEGRDLGLGPAAVHAVRNADDVEVGPRHRDVEEDGVAVGGDRAAELVERSREIGRASCRERGEVEGDSGALKERGIE